MKSKILFLTSFAVSLTIAAYPSTSSAATKERLMSGVASNITEIQKFSQQIAKVKKASRASFCKKTLPKLLAKANKNYDTILSQKKEATLSGDRAVQSLAALDLLAKRYSCSLK